MPPWGQIAATAAAVSAVVGAIIVATSKIENRLSTVETKLDGIASFDLNGLNERVVHVESIVHSLSGTFVAQTRLDNEHENLGHSAQAKTSQIVLSPPFNIDEYYVPSGWMGDWQHIKFDPHSRACAERPGNDDSTCIAISYPGGPAHWAGIYWLFPEGNWGDEQGAKIDDASEIRFWAKGKSGMERILFKSGGVRTPGKSHQDTFLVAETIELTPVWQEYILSLSGQDLSSTIGIFAWVASENENLSGVEFLLDNVEVR